MKFLVTGRMHGKTTQLMKWMEEHPEAICVVHSAMELERLSKIYKIDRSRFITTGQALDGSVLAGLHSPVVIDNLDIFLQRIFSNNEVQAVTATGEVWPRTWPET